MIKYIKTAFFMLTITISGLCHAKTVASISPQIPFDPASNEETPGNYEEWKVFNEVIGGEEGWKLARDKDGITIYLRHVKVTPIKHFKALMELDIELSTLVAFMNDVDAFPDYLRLCNMAKMLHRINERVSYIHTINKLPWPVSVRDSIGYTCWSQDPDTLITKVNILGLRDYIPPIKGYVRVPFLVMQFILTPKENGKIEIRFEGTAEAGGWIPNWIANFVVVDTPWVTFKKIQKGMPFEKYKNTKIPWLIEPPKIEKKYLQKKYGQLPEKTIE